jgi:ketosteroid isomerase-like protein
MSCTKNDDLMYADDLKVSENPEIKTSNKHGNFYNNGNLKHAKEALRDMLETYEAAVNAEDFDLWISNWAEDGVQLPPNAPPRIGVDEITANSQPNFESGANFVMDIYSIDEVNIMHGGKWGVTRCKYNFKVIFPDGTEIWAMEDGKALTVFKKVNGAWKIAYDCFNSNLPPA